MIFMIFVFDINPRLLTKLVWLLTKIMIFMIFVDVIDSRLSVIKFLTVNKNYEIPNFCFRHPLKTPEEVGLAIDKNYDFHDFC